MKRLLLILFIPLLLLAFRTEGYRMGNSTYKSYWMLGDTLFFTDGGADTNWVVNDGNYLKFGGDNLFYFGNSAYFSGTVIRPINDTLTYLGIATNRWKEVIAKRLIVTSPDKADSVWLSDDGTNGILNSDNPFAINTSVNYAADAQGDDDYEVAIPGITALVAGLTVTFLAQAANTNGATLEITSVGDLDAILKNHDTALATNDIKAGAIVVVVFDGSDWQMVSQLSQ